MVSNTGFKGICQRNHLCTWKYFNINHLPKTIFGHTKEKRLKNATMHFWTHPYLTEKPFGVSKTNLNGWMTNETRKIAIHLAQFAKAGCDTIKKGGNNLKNCFWWYFWWWRWRMTHRINKALCFLWVEAQGFVVWWVIWVLFRWGFGTCAWA